MRIGFRLTPFWSPATRNATELIDEAVRLAGAVARMGCAWASAILARLAPETGRMRLKILPLLNAVDAASLATLDHPCHGRLDVGVGVGHREAELTTAGVLRPGGATPR